MEINDYKKADCRLFRTPPIDISKYQLDIERTIVELWREGRGAEYAAKLITGGKVVNDIAGQISENLDFQRRAQTEIIEQEHSQSIQAYEEQHRREVAQIEERLGAETEERRKKLLEAQAQYQQTNQHYSSAAARLEEMRARVKGKIGALGGTDGIDMLHEIEKQLASPIEAHVKKTDTEYKEPKVKKNETTEEKPSLKVLEEKPLNDEQQSTGLEEILVSDKKITPRIWRRIWDILNYKLW